MKVGLVLGGGGVVGLSYHAGVLRALDEVGGVQANDADVVVGTSAGSVVAAYLRSGWSSDDFWKLSQNSHETLAGLTLDDEGRARDLMTWAVRTPADLVRRGFGSLYVLGRSMSRLPTPPLPGVVRRAFPGGFYAMVEGQRRFAQELPAEWPSKPLWLTAVDIVGGRRVVFGRPGAPAATLQQAVLASCAIPGVYQPVRIGRRVYVDGGVRSSTNLDLANAAGCDLIIVAAPMAFDTTLLPSSLQQVVRHIPARSLSREVAAARARGAEVLMLRPSSAEVALHGINLMRQDRVADVARAAYEVTARTLDSDRFRRALEPFAA